MIYLMNNIGQVKEYKEHDVKTIDSLVSSGRWKRVTGRKDTSLYEEPKKSTPKKETKKPTKKTKKKSK